jgi:hypothetical protein
MAGTRTAPTVGAEPTLVTVTAHFIDASGDIFTQILPISSARTDAEIEAWVASYQAGTNASCWKVTGTSIFVGEKDAANAIAAFRASIASGVNILFKDVDTGETLSERLIAPIAGVMDGDKDIPIMDSTEMAALIAATLVLTPAYTLQQGQFTGRTERRNNPVINA